VKNNFTRETKRARKSFDLERTNAATMRAAKAEGGSMRDEKSQKKTGAGRNTEWGNQVSGGGRKMRLNKNREGLSTHGTVGAGSKAGALRRQNAIQNQVHEQEIPKRETGTREEIHQRGGELVKITAEKGNEGLRAN
jgi:hypothetical protein